MSSLSLLLLLVLFSLFISLISLVVLVLLLLSVLSLSLLLLLVVVVVLMLVVTVVVQATVMNLEEGVDLLHAGQRLAGGLHTISISVVIIIISIHTIIRFTNSSIRIRTSMQLSRFRHTFQICIEWLKIQQIERTVKLLLHI